MKKTNQFICFTASLRGRFALLFCLGCFVFTITSGQVTDSTKGPENTDGKGNKTIVTSSTKCCNQLFVGPSTISEDSYNRFNTYGASVAFTHPVTSRIGITGDAGIYFGSNSGVNYTKFQLLGGLSLLSLPGQDNRVSFSPHLLGGVSGVSSKYKLETNTFTNSSTGLSMAVGTDVSFPINNKTAIVARADYNPAFSSNSVKSNFRLGVGFKLNLGCRKDQAVVNNQDLYTREREECKASKNTKELKISLGVLDEIIKSTEEIANKIPRVELKIFVKPELTVKQGEECCSKDKPPVTYTELKGGVEGGYELNINLWGIPDINYSLKVWPVLFIAEFKLKVYAGPTGKIALEGVGKAYGDLLGKDPRPDCKGCIFFNIKAEGFLRIGIKAGGGIKIYHWSPLGKGKAGFDILEKPDEEIEISAEASASIGNTFNGTWAGIGDCTQPEKGLHGVFKIGKAKANLKFNVKLGPLSFDPNFEINLFDGKEFKF